MFEDKSVDLGFLNSTVDIIKEGYFDLKNPTSVASQTPLLHITPLYRWVESVVPFPITPP